ncbi:hypothetical protein E4U54_003948 [Claviceps lovelessii]|nr:hypothetical protein E4U54_003948 [Claviceps lovelessii]
MVCGGAAVRRMGRDGPGWAGVGRGGRGGPGGSEKEDVTGPGDGAITWVQVLAQNDVPDSYVALKRLDTSNADKPTSRRRANSHGSRLATRDG